VGYATSSKLKFSGQCFQMLLRAPNRTDTETHAHSAL